MNMSMEISIFLAYAIAILLVYIFGKLLLVPAKMLGKLILNSIIGGIFIIFVNLCGAHFGIFIPLNIINAIIVGILGIPGAGLLLILSV
jgi:inhibitor of the pro-sigma K processing machinery